MTRKEGFIEVDKMLQEIGVDTTSIDTILASPFINEIDYIADSKIHFSFLYHNQIYYFKKDTFRNYSPYNELIADELAKDFGIPCIEYDLAILGNYRGIISRNFELENEIYISRECLVEPFGILEYYDSDLDNDFIPQSRYIENNLEDIWDRLEQHYHSYPNKNEIVAHLMKQIVNIYLFDIITSQGDRNECNWQIMMSNDAINIAPIFDNERILVNENSKNMISLGVNFNEDDFETLFQSIKNFQQVSSSEFTDIIKDKLWIISEENLHKVFERIEKKTGYLMPEKEKKFYLNGYQEHKKRLEEVLENKDVRKR